MDLATVVVSAVFGALAGGASSFLLDVWRGRRDAHLRRLQDTRHRIMDLQHWLLDLYAHGLQGQRQRPKEQVADHRPYADLEWIGEQQALDAFVDLFYTILHERDRPHQVSVAESHWFGDALALVSSALDEQDALARQGRSPPCLMGNSEPCVWAATLRACLSNFLSQEGNPAHVPTRSHRSHPRLDHRRVRWQPGGTSVADAGYVRGHPPRCR